MRSSAAPTVDELLADSLVQAVMRADHVEPQALRTLLGRSARRLADSRRARRRAGRARPRPARLVSRTARS